MKLNRIVLIGAVLSLALFLAGCTRPQAQVEAASAKAPGQRQKAPDFRLQDSHGKMLRLSDYKGKVVLLNFWATWCPPCKIEIPWFMEFEKQYKDQGFAVIGVSLDEDGWDAVRPFLKRAQLNYRVVVGDSIVEQLYGGVESLPTTFMIDRQGRVANVHLGLVSKDDYREDIEGLLKDASATQASAATR